VLHVLNGDATRWILDRSDVPGERTVWADVLHDGPTPARLSREAFRRVRADFLAERFGEFRAYDTLSEWDAGLDRYVEQDEVVFWLEHDLFDQLILLHHLHWLASLPATTTTFSLICIGEFPGVARFTGLGSLEPGQLASLVARRVPVSRQPIAAGQRGWNLFCAPDPRPLQDWLEEGVPLLPFLPGALLRHFEDYPDVNDGLSRTERQILAAIDEGHATPWAVFRACQAREERVYMGDATFWAILKDLHTVIEPLVTLSDAPLRMPRQGVLVALTPVGEQVLAGRADHVALNGLDRWMGGVHLTDRNWTWTGRRVEAG
jgi:hypothetical protein